MKRTIRDKLTPFGTHWEMLAIPVVLFVLVAVFVDLRPVVDENFFFATSDPGVRQSKKIEQQFPSRPQRRRSREMFRGMRSSESFS